MDNPFFLYVPVFVALVLAISLTGDEPEQDHRCEMVAKWEQTGGEYGWPPESVDRTGDCGDDNYRASK